MIKTGKAPLPIVTYIAIMSVCFIINLPGVAITPVEGKLKAILGTSELEIQLLTTLPNFVIIPFVIIAGKLSDYKHKIILIALSLALFITSGLIYLFGKTFGSMIVASCLLGVADGILIPFAMGFIVNAFDGKYRTRNLGIKSATSNLGTVIGGFVAGLLILQENWRLPFLIYSVSIIPLCLCYWLKYIPGFGTPIIQPANAQISDSNQQNKSGIDYKKIWELIGNNFLITLITFSVVIYFPQIIQEMKLSPKLAGEILAVFFISVLFTGFLLEKIIKSFKSFTFPFIGLLNTAGFALIIFTPAIWSMYCGAVLIGIGFGIVQPLIYDKTSYAVTNPVRNIYALSLVLCALYIAIAAEPFIITGISSLFKVKDVNHFAFYMSFGLAIFYMLLSFFLRKKFVFSIEKNYYS